MRNLKFLSAFMLIISLNAFAIPEGAFTTLHVKAKDVDKYIALMKKILRHLKLLDQILPVYVLQKLVINIQVKCSSGMLFQVWKKLLQQLTYMIL